VHTKSLTHPQCRVHLTELKNGADEKGKCNAMRDSVINFLYHSKQWHYL
jgi:hypothetical protein